MTIYARWFFRMFIQKDVIGIALFPVILVRDKALLTDRCLIHHEKIHLRQQLELLILPFYIWYLLEFLWRWANTKSIKKAYLTISFEREAFENENNLRFLQKRKFWNFLNYL